MGFIFLIAGAAGIAYLVRVKGLLPVSAYVDAVRTIRSRPRTKASVVGNRGWLLLYMVGLAAQLVHGLVLTIGALVIYADPSLVGRDASIPWWGLVIYVVSNLGLLAYGVVLFTLMLSKRRAAIPNAIVFNALSVAFLVTWFVLRAKSPVGTAVDSLPSLAAIAYFARSRRVRRTFVRP